MGLLLSDPAAPPIRVTRDIDALVELASLADYHRLSKRLRHAGFADYATDQAPICRWTEFGFEAFHLTVDDQGPPACQYCG